MKMSTIIMRSHGRRNTVCGACILKRNFKQILVERTKTEKRDIKN